MCTSTEQETVFVRCASHRASAKVRGIIGRDAKCYWSWDHPAPGGYYKVPVDRIADARKIKGVTVTRFGPELRECWPSSYPQ